MMNFNKMSDAELLESYEQRDLLSNSRLRFLMKIRNAKSSNQAILQKRPKKRRKIRNLSHEKTQFYQEVTL